MGIRTGKPEFCYYCGVQVFANAEKSQGCPCGMKFAQRTVDHMVPKWIGGTLVGNNVVACHDCNQQKGPLTAEEYRIVLAFRRGLVSGVEFKFPGEEQ